MDITKNVPEIKPEQSKVEPKPTRREIAEKILNLPTTEGQDVKVQHEVASEILLFAIQANFSK